MASVLGSLLTGFVLIPLVGLEQTLSVATGLVIIASATALLMSGGGLAARTLAAGPLVIALVVGFSAARWDRELLASGSYNTRRTCRLASTVETALNAGTLLYYKDGPTGTVSVKRLTGTLSLAIDGKVDASTAGDMLTQKLLAHLPLLLHDDPIDVCIIGLGSGITLASALIHPIADVDVLEISPRGGRGVAPLRASATSPLDDPRTRLLVG